MKQWIDLQRMVAKHGKMLDHDHGESGMQCVLGCPITGRQLRVIASWGADWDHVSVTPAWKDPGNPLDSIPVWQEMAWLDEMFFEPEEWSVQYHPAKSTYKNTHERCLHIWRPQKTSVPTPPQVLV